MKTMPFAARPEHDVKLLLFFTLFRRETGVINHLIFNYVMKGEQNERFLEENL